MRYGFCIPHHRLMAAPELILEATRRGEALGYDALWLSDHVVPRDTPDQRQRRIFYEPIALAGVVAGVTSRVRIGFTVLVVPYRHPVVTAKQLATLDAMSGGRLDVGVGVGWMEEEFRALGADFHRRGRLTDEYLRAMRELWTSDRPRFEGETIQFSGLNAWPRPVQQPLPVLVGGYGSAAIRRAAALGDGWHPSNMALADLEPRIREFRAACQQAGRPATLPIVYRSDVSLGASASGPRKAFSGSAAEILADLQAFAAAGVDEMVFDFAVPPVETADDWLAALQRFTDEVLPRAPR
jgi:probable F420-dependent oxidoreductase